MVALDPGGDVLGLERLDEERVEDGMFAYRGCLHRCEDYRHAWAVSANVVSNRRPVSNGAHTQIGDDRIDRDGLQDSHGLFGIVSLEDVKPLLAEHIGHHPPHDELVLGDEDLQIPPSLDQARVVFLE